MRHVSKWLKQNTMLKLLSLAVAFVIWLTVVNFSNPDTRGTQTVDLTVQNVDKLTSADKIYDLDTDSIRISYTVRTKYRNVITPEDFEAYIDLNDYSITGAVPVYVKTSDRLTGMISDVTPNPIVVHVTTENLQRKRFDVELTTTGSAAEGYIAGQGQLPSDSDHVYISGPESEIGQISKVGIEVSVEEASSEVSGEDASLHFYDANGNAITTDDRITLSRTAFAYQVPVYRIKSLSISAGTVGEPEEGYALEGLDMSPAFVQVYGPDEVLDRHVSVNIPGSEMNIAGAVKSLTRSIDVSRFLPEGLSLAQPGGEVTIVAKIRKLPETSATDESDGETAETTERSDGNQSGTEPAAGDGAAESGEPSEMESTAADSAAETEAEAEGGTAAHEVRNNGKETQRETAAKSGPHETKAE